MSEASAWTMQPMADAVETACAASHHAMSSQVIKTDGVERMFHLCAASNGNVAGPFYEMNLAGRKAQREQGMFGRMSVGTPRFQGKGAAFFVADVSLVPYNMFQSMFLHNPLGKGPSPNMLAYAGHASADVEAAAQALVIGPVSEHAKTECFHRGGEVKDLGHNNWKCTGAGAGLDFYVFHTKNSTWSGSSDKAFTVAVRDGEVLYTMIVNSKAS